MFISLSLSCPSRRISLVCRNGFCIPWLLLLEPKKKKKKKKKDIRGYDVPMMLEISYLHANDIVPESTRTRMVKKKNPIPPAKILTNQDFFFIKKTLMFLQLNFFFFF